MIHNFAQPWDPSNYYFLDDRSKNEINNNKRVKREMFVYIMYIQSRQ